MYLPAVSHMANENGKQSLLKHSSESYLPSLFPGPPLPFFFFFLTRWDDAHAPEVAVWAIRLKQAEKLGEIIWYWRDWIIWSEGEGAEGEQNHFSAPPLGRTLPEGVRGAKQKEAKIWTPVVTYLKIQPVLFVFFLYFYQLTRTLIWVWVQAGLPICVNFLTGAVAPQSLSGPLIRQTHNGAVDSGVPCMEPQALIRLVSLMLTVGERGPWPSRVKADTGGGGAMPCWRQAIVTSAGI